MEQKKNKRKLRSLLINFQIQHKIITLDILFMMVVMILTIVIVNNHIIEKVAEMSEMGISNAGSLMIPLSIKLYVILAITFILAILIQLWVTHRVCGAFVNFTNVFKKISDGDLNQMVVLRKSDLLKKEATIFNEMIGKINQQFEALKEENRKLRMAGKEE